MPAEAAAADEIEPRPGVLLSGAIQFPREQAMTIETDPRDGSKLTVRMAFDGRCKGGGIGEVWASRIESRPTVRVRNGPLLRRPDRHRARPRRRQGPRSASSRWRLTGRFTDRDVVVATVTGSADIVVGRKRRLALQDRRAGRRPARDPFVALGGRSFCGVPL